MKWFGRQAYTPINGAENEDQVDVDQISFTSSGSSGVNESKSRLDIDLISFDNPNDPGPSEISLISEPEPIFPPFINDEPTTSSEVFNESLLVRNSLFWFNDDEVDYSKLRLPISNRGRVCRFENDVDDNNLETLCRSLQITMGLNERNRWLNMISKDPDLMALAKELDEEFPLAGTSKEKEEFELETERSHAQSVSTISSTAGSFKTMSNGEIETIEGSSNVPNNRIVRVVVPARNGIDAFEFRRRINETPKSICEEILKQSIKNDEPIDRRMNVWMNEFATNADNWIADIAPGTRKHDNYAFEVPKLTEDWILHVHKQMPIRQAMETQQWKCASCRQSLSMLNLNDKEVAPKFCEYYGYYFCTLCHGGEKIIIPARIINMWNFNEMPVSDRAFRFLRSVRERPVLRIRTLSNELIRKNKALRTVIELRNKLKHMEQFIKICDLASKQITENGNLATIFASLDRYLLESDDLFSLNDLLRIHNKDLLVLLEPLAKNAKNHILRCERCLQRAHVCVRCNDYKDRLFPFEDRISRCEECGALSHMPKCPHRDVPKDSSCPKCARILKTRSRQRILAVGTVGDV